MNWKNWIEQRQSKCYEPIRRLRTEATVAESIGMIAPRPTVWTFGAFVRLTVRTVFRQTALIALLANYRHRRSPVQFMFWISLTRINIDNP